MTEKLNTFEYNPKVECLTGWGLGKGILTAILEKKERNRLKMVGNIKRLEYNRAKETDMSQEQLQTIVARMRCLQMA